MDEIVDPGHFVLEASLQQLLHGSIIRCRPRRLSDFHDTNGAIALLHAARHLEGAAYFGQAVIENYEPATQGHGMLVFLSKIELFRESISTLENGSPREEAPFDAGSKLAFSFYARGLRPISQSGFNAILAAAGEGTKLVRAGFGETEQVHPVDGASPTLEMVRTELVVRRARARMRSELMQHHGAFCCLSGASYDVPGGPSLLQVSHYRPLGHSGPDTTDNAGLMSPIVNPIYENGLECIRPDYSMRFAPDIPPGFLSEFRGRTKMSVSGNLRFVPSEANLAYHREEIFMRRLRRLGLSQRD